MRIVGLGRETLDAFRGLFEAASCGCFCRWWHFEGTKNEWLDRCAHRPEENLSEQAAAALREDDDARGLLALDGHEAVGWMKLAPLAAVPKLRGLPVYRALDLGERAWAVGCFLVHPRARRSGVARALLEAAPAYAGARGAHAILGFPRRSSAPLYDEEAWQGPEALFRALGYELLHDEPPYPVYRKVLASA